jgi:protein SCO1/2
MTVAALLSLVLLVNCGLGNEAPAGSRLAVIRKAPDFVLTDQNGKTVQSRDLAGKVLLVGFVFTTCNGTCPATTHRMCQVQEELKKRGLKDRVQLISITLDPARDTPDVLQNYMRLYEADPADWSFLTGPAYEVAKVITAWGMWARPAANGQLDHPSRVFLVDQAGRVREIYNLNFLKPAWVLADTELLLAEGSRTAQPRSR